MRPRLAIALAAPLVAAMTAAGWYVFGPATGGAAADPARIAEGKALYDAYCASCHGADLQGEPGWQRRRPDGTLPAPPQDETGHTWHHPDSQLFIIIRDGMQAGAGPEYQSAMTGFGDVLSDDEIHAVLDYIKSHWPEEVRRMQAEMSREAEGD